MNTMIPSNFSGPPTVKARLCKKIGVKVKTEVKFFNRTPLVTLCGCWGQPWRHRLLLAYRSDDYVDRFYTERNGVDLLELKKELVEIRHRGYAYTQNRRRTEQDNRGD